MKAVIYQDLIDENLHGYQLKEVSGEREIIILSDGVIPGLEGWSQPIYITTLTDGNLLVIAQTNYELGIAKRKAIIKGAIAFFNFNK